VGGTGQRGGDALCRFAVTHLPVDPWEMGKEGWHEKLAEREAAREKRMEENFQRLRVKTKGSGKPATPEHREAQGDFFNEKPENGKL